MQSSIYVPQGSAATLTTTSSSFEITGLYTDDFSSCNIFVCIDKEKIILIHADRQVPPESIKAEIEWVGEPNETIVIIKEKGKVIWDQLEEYFKTDMPKQKFIVKTVADHQDGIFVSFLQQQNNSIHPQIKITPKGQKPINLIHHPDEQKILAVEKIEQIVGVRAKVQTNLIRVKQLSIFDGRAWEAMDDWQGSIDISQQSTRDEMAMFNKQDTCLVLARKLGKIMEASKELAPVIGDRVSHAINVAFYLEGYLNAFDYERLFKNNIKELLENSDGFPDYKPVSEEDKRIQTQLLKIIEDTAPIFDEAGRLVQIYETVGPPTVFKENFLKEYRNFSEHYKNRKDYKVQAEHNSAVLTKAELTSQRAVKEFNKGNFAATKNLFLEIIVDITPCCTKRYLGLAQAYHSLGRSLYKLGAVEEASILLGISLDYKEKFVKGATERDITKTKNALNDCKEFLERKAIESSVSSLVQPAKDSMSGLQSTQ